jgi:hypothetical protein
MDGINLDTSFLLSEAPKDPFFDGGRLEIAHELLVGRALGRAEGFPILADSKIPGHTFEPVHVVGMSVSQDQIIDFFDSFAPEEARDDILADIEGVVGDPAAVHEHLLSARELDQNRISLSDIKESQLEGPGGTGRKGIRDKESKEDTEDGEGQELLSFDLGAEKQKKKEEEISQNDRQRRRGDSIRQERNRVKEMGRPEKEVYQELESLSQGLAEKCAREGEA